ncbi:YhzD-like protein [Marininema mesophilum]|uniref:YhzD-like protein n=1 Tax=Marininema mesophilum TaxID=1048340 RepID=A0A1H2ZYB0_9BACL|nr:YhzD family protein [Marininema mesophilum]SDX22387.1 YhzD-like protein [Marininema mesophilum]
MYHITAFDNEGNKLIDQSIEAQNDTQAKEKGQAILQEKEATGSPFRIIHNSGRLIDFLSHKGKSAKEKA